MFWGDVVLCVVYLRNKIPSHAPNNKTPYETWHGCIPSVRHLRVLVPPIIPWIPKEKRNKLGARSHKCISLGYSNTSKVYHVYDDIDKKFMLSRDVMFLEFCKDDNIVE